MSDPAEYRVPEGILGLKGPMARPAPGTLPLRGDLAHIALADRYLVAHYVVPQLREIGVLPAELKLAPDAGSASVAILPSGSSFELLDVAGDWCWGCVSADGPTGYISKKALAPPKQ